MSDTLDLICPKCKIIVKNICLMTVDWMVELDCREYINHIDNCELQKILENKS